MPVPSSRHFLKLQPRTRFYLPSSGAAPVSVSPDSAWDDISSYDSLAMATSRSGSPMTNKTVSTFASVSNTLVRQYVGPQYPAQLLNTDIRLYARASQLSGSLGATSRLGLRIVSADGGTVRGTLLPVADYSPGSQFQTSAADKSFATASLFTPFSLQNGDRPVLEIGFHHLAVVSSATIRFGDDNAADLPENESSGGDNNAWFEIGQVLNQLAFLTLAAGVTPGVTYQKQVRKFLATA